MTTDVARLPMRRPPTAVRVVATSPAREPTSAAGRLLELRDAANEQRLARSAIESCCSALRQSLSQLRAAVDSRLADVAATAAELGLAVAHELVGDALARGAFDPVPVVRRCLQQAVVAGDRAAIAVRMSPADLERVQASLAEETGQGVSFVADSALPPGSVRVETGAGMVAYDPSEVLRRLSDELRKELAACR